MKINASLLKRFGYYFAGCAIGIVVVTMINKQKGTTFDYGPNARTLKQLRLREVLLYSDKATLKMQEYVLDSVDIQYVLHKGDVDFDKGAPRQKPCHEYWVDANIGKNIKGEIVNKPYSFIFQRCDKDTIATLLDVIKH